MEFEELALKGLVLLKPRVFADERGFFLERYTQRTFQQHGVDLDFVQDNHSYSVKNVLRGLHFQRPPCAQDKLVWAVRGEVFDVAVDLRRDSPTFGQWAGVTLSAENKHMLLVPKGFAHGFVVLSEEADFLYKTSAFYSQEHDGGLLWNDPDVAVAWPVSNPLLSDKDRVHPTLRELIAQGAL